MSRINQNTHLQRDVSYTVDPHATFLRSGQESSAATVCENTEMWKVLALVRSPNVRLAN